MSDSPNDSHKSLDTSPLTLEQLSDHELAIILKIEQQLQMRQPRDSKDAAKEKPYLASVHVRSPNALLLDGARGTGKTSLLLTMAHRWIAGSNCEFKRNASSDTRINARENSIGKARSTFRETIPHRIHPLRILDFDPIPKQMPLIAGIIDAWRLIVVAYDEMIGFPADFDDEGEKLEDRWEKLFRVAAVGWSAVPATKGLLEQVLDRQEQVRDWQGLGQRWHQFVTEVIKCGKRLEEPHRLVDDPVFVIMIDDVDLQVEKIRELLPALRLLYHPNVSFLVAADWDHLVDTLKTDFVGQHNRLASRAVDSHTTSDDYGKRWAGTLAFAAATKVFPLKNKWALRRLTLHELLAFPGSGGGATDSQKFDGGTPLTMKSILNDWPNKSEDRRQKDVKLGEYLNKSAGFQQDPYAVPALITYRDAHQIFERVLMEDDDERRAIEAVRLLISSPETEAVKLGGIISSPETEAVELGGTGVPEPLVEYQGVGELVALFGPGYVEPISESSDIEISARPDFVLRKGRFPDPGYTPEAVDNASDRNRAMLAVTIQEGLYGVAAPGMRWDIRLALAWTSVTIPHENSFLRLAFQWPLHEHPHPFRLLAWSHEWSELVRSIQSSPEERLERIAYAWMFYQAKWLGGDIGKARGPLETTKISCDNWKLLMNVKLPMSLIKGRNRPKYLDWRTQTLPLLARPEIGLPPPLQEILLSPVNGGTSMEGRRDQLGWLKDQRRRLVTDAIIAAGEEEGRPAENAENEKRVDGIVNELEKQHGEVHGDVSPWWNVVEENLRETHDEREM